MAIGAFFILEETPGFNPGRRSFNYPQSYLVLRFIHQFFSGGRVRVDKIYPTTGTKALSQLFGSWIKTSQTHAIK